MGCWLNPIEVVNLISALLDSIFSDFCGIGDYWFLKGILLTE
jgi:hypothetical protein